MHTHTHVQAAELITARFPQHMELKFERVMCPFVLLHVNRYAGAVHRTTPHHTAHAGHSLQYWPIKPLLYCLTCIMCQSFSFLSWQACELAAACLFRGLPQCVRCGAMCHVLCVPAAPHTMRRPTMRRPAMRCNGLRCDGLRCNGACDGACAGRSFESAGAAAARHGALLVKGLRSMWRQAAPYVQAVLQVGQRVQGPGLRVAVTPKSRRGEGWQGGRDGALHGLSMHVPRYHQSMHVPQYHVTAAPAPA